MILRPPETQLGQGSLMKLKKALIALTILISVHANSGFTQEEEISAEDLEVIELLDILEDLDLLEEDLDLLDTLTEIGDDHER